MNNQHIIPPDIDYRRIEEKYRRKIAVNYLTKSLNPFRTYFINREKCDHICRRYHEGLLVSCKRQILIDSVFSSIDAVIKYHFCKFCGSLFIYEPLD